MNILQKTLHTIRAAAGDYRGLADQCIHAPKAKANYLATAADFDAAAKIFEESVLREVALRAEVETLTIQRDALATVADKLLTDLENVVEGLDPEEAKQVAEMREQIEAARP